jgi:hypothetical protein
MVAFLSSFAIGLIVGVLTGITIVILGLNLPSLPLKTAGGRRRDAAPAAS